MATGKVLVTGSSVDEELLKPLTEAGLTIVNPQHLLSEAELSDQLRDCRAYLLGGEEHATRAAIEAATQLEIIAFLGVGYDSFIDVQTASARGIVVTNTPGTLTNSVAEFTVGHLLNATRRITEYSNSYRRGEREGEVKQHDLAEMTVGIIGLGDIGSRIAKILVGFDCKIQYFSRTRKPDVEDSLGITYKELSDLASSSNILIVMTPGTASTANLLDRKILSLVPTGTILINTARYEVVEPEALREALLVGKVSIAAYDVFYDGGIGEQLLSEFGEDRLIVTGHIASLTHEARDGMAVKAVRSILNVVAGKDDEDIVNREELASSSRS